MNEVSASEAVQSRRVARRFVLLIAAKLVLIAGVAIAVVYTL